MSMQLSKLADSDSNCSLARQRILSISIIITYILALLFASLRLHWIQGLALWGCCCWSCCSWFDSWKLTPLSPPTRWTNKSKSGRLPKMAAYTTVCAVSLDSVQAFRGLVLLHCTGARFLKLASWLCSGRGSCQKKNCKSWTRFGPEWIRDGFCMILHYTCILYIFIMFGVLFDFHAAGVGTPNWGCAKAGRVELLFPSLFRVSMGNMSIGFNWFNWTFFLIWDSRYCKIYYDLWPTILH